MNSRPGMPGPHQLLELRGLIAGLCDAELTPSQVARLEEMVCEFPACAAYYVNAMSVYATLPQHVGVDHKTSGLQLISQWQSRDNEFWNDVVTAAAELESPLGTPLPTIERKVHLPPRQTVVKRLVRFVTTRSQTTWIVLLCATTSMLALLLGWMFFTGGNQNHPPVANESKALPAVVASLSKVRQIQWGVGQRPIATGARLTAGQRIAIGSGTAEITFDSGAVVAIQGPTEFEIKSTSEGFLHRGSLVANVPPAARGFAVQAAGVRIVDLGTRFGVDVDSRTSASVHVLTGVVEAFLPAAGNRSLPVRIEANRAVHYDASTKHLEQVPVDRPRFEIIEEQLRRPVIAEVKASSGKAYEIVPGGLHEDARAYIDRVYEWNSIDASGIPRAIRDADFVRSSNNDDLAADFTLEVTVSEPADLYVFFDDRAQTPAWLTRDYVNTGDKIGLDTGTREDDFAKGPGRSVDVQFSIWKRHIGRGTTTCGSTNQSNVAHYGLAVVAESK